MLWDTRTFAIQNSRDKTKWVNKRIRLRLWSIKTNINKIIDYSVILVKLCPVR